MPRRAPIQGHFTLQPEFVRFIERRTLPFLDSVGLSRPLTQLLSEAYLQGARDVLQIFENKCDVTKILKGGYNDEKTD